MRHLSNTFSRLIKLSLASLLVRMFVYSHDTWQVRNNKNRNHTGHAIPLLTLESRKEAAMGRKTTKANWPTCWIKNSVLFYNLRSCFFMVFLVNSPTTIFMALGLFYSWSAGSESSFPYNRLADIISVSDWYWFCNAESFLFCSF